MEDMTPRQIVEELDKYIIGQEKAKRAVAIALRNRHRRRLLPEEMREEVIPKNILMIGPTGVGKTEIARRLATLANAPFVKVEATKFTEVGYVGRDVDSMVRDLVQVAIRMIQTEKMAEVRPKAEEAAIERVLDLLAPRPSRERTASPFEPMMRSLGGFLGRGVPEPETEPTPEDDQVHQEEAARAERLRDKLRGQLEAGTLDDRKVEVEVEEANTAFMPVFSQGGMEEMGVNLQDMLGGMVPKRKKTRKVTVAEARKILADEEAGKLIDMDDVTRTALERAEQSGIIFVDELDKIAGKSAQGSGPDVSREGVQRDILPIIEGSTVVTKHGTVRTNHILFIAAGAFHISKPSDLIPELQGRLPIRVELDSLNEGDFKRILTEPRNALVKQYVDLLATEGVELEFTPSAIEEIARVATQVNTQTENIGARRLHTVMEHLLDEISFTASERSGDRITVDADYVHQRLATIAGSEDLSRYIL